MAQDYSGSSVTSSPWESSHGASPDSHSHSHSHSLGTSSADVPSYGSPIDGKLPGMLHEWVLNAVPAANDLYHSRQSGYAMPRYIDSDDRSASSYGSSTTGMLEPSYNFTSNPYGSPQENDGLTLTTDFPRRMSAASMSSAEAIASGEYYDGTDDASSYNGSAYEHTPLTSAISTPLSPAPLGGSPLSTYRVPGSRTRLSPSPNHSYKDHGVGPYTIPGVRNKPVRWSTGNYPSGSVDPQLQTLSSTFTSTHSSPVCPPSQPPPQHYLPSHTPPYSSQPPTQLLGPSCNSHIIHGHLCRTTLPSSPNAGFAPGYGETEYCEPPDLYGSSREEHLPPPPEDMDPEDPEMKPHEQDLRFDGDLYTPRWVRGHGNKREGWCGLCKPGRWLVLKNSAFWYDKSFTHGISAATGLQFTGPRDMRRMDGNPDVWEGLCHSCNEWVPLVSNKKKGTTWFRHAYKCHTHPKIKDAPKRRRESSQGRRARQVGN